jgi:DNA (cytosine-5)-methyltransferase 1
MSAYYNDNDDYVCAWLRNLMDARRITPGTIDSRSIQEVRPHDLNGFTRCHFFAGVAGWDLALRLAGWPDDEPVWTGSCPCQPWSEAGKGLGAKDPRHLWPELLRLIRQCHPPTIFGEQVEAAISRGWLDRVFADLEREGYACGAAVLGAHSVGAPHIRQRIYWVAHAPGKRLFRAERADSAGIAASVSAKRPEPAYREYHGRRISVEPGDVPLVDAIPSDMGSGEPKLRRLVRSARANQAGRTRAYGNAVVPELATEFIRAAAEGIREMRTDTERSGNDNMFGNLTLKKLEQALSAQWAEIVKAEPNGTPGPADAYWVFGDGLHELRKRKRLSPEECIEYVCGTFGFDEYRPLCAMTIRDDCEDRPAVAGMTVQEAYDNPPKPKARKKSKGKSRPRRVAHKSGPKAAPSSNGTVPTQQTIKSPAPWNAQYHAETSIVASSDNNGKPTSPLEEWNRQLDVVRSLIISAAKGYRNGLLLHGPSGGGKTYIVEQTLKDLGLTWAEAPKGLTPQGLLEFFEEFGSGIMLFDDVADLFKTERGRKYMMAAFGTRPDYTQPRVVPYAREGRKMSVTVTGCCFIMTNEEHNPRAFASRITTLEYAPTQEQIAALMRDIASRDVKRQKWELSGAECTEVAEFLIPEAGTLKVQLDLRDLIEKSLPDYALWKDGHSKVDWRDLVRAHLLGKLSELKHTPPKPMSRASRLDKEREAVREILRLFPKSRAEQLEAWRAKFPNAGDRRFDRRKSEVRDET